MKKTKFLMLFALAVLLFGCREELTQDQPSEASVDKHSQNNVTSFKEFLNITKNSKNLFSSENGKNDISDEFEIDTSYILKRTKQGNTNAFSFLLKKKNEVNKKNVYNMFYYKGKTGDWKYFIVKITHDPNPQKLYGWKKTTLYKYPEGVFNKGCYPSMEFGNVDWFQCSAGHSSSCSKNGGACCAGCHHSMAVSYWVNTCDEAAPDFDVNYGGGSGGNPITMEDIKIALQNNVSPEVYNKFLLLPFNLQQGVIDCLYNNYLTDNLVTFVINFLYDYPNTQNPDLIYYKIADVLSLNQNLLLDNNVKANNSIVFTNKQDFNTALLTKNTSITTESSILQENGSEKVVSARVKRTGIWGSGEEVRVKLKKINNVWAFDSVTSSELGLTLGVWTFTQIDYTQNTNANVLTVEVTGYENYNVFLEGLGTVYKDKVMIRVKINITTGNIFSIEFIDL